MKAAIISLGSVSSQWIYNSMKKYFDEVDMLSLQDIEVNMGNNGAEVLHQGVPLKNYDCIYAKGSFKYSSVLRAITSVMWSKTKYMPIKAGAFTIGQNKLLTHLKLQTNDVPMPRTYITATTRAAKEILQKINYPIIMKLPAGTQGKGVMFAESYPSASSMLDTLAALKQPFIIQEYVESGGIDVRAIVVGDKVVAAMKRKATGGEKRANIHAGGIGEAYVIDKKTESIAIKAAKVLKAEICGVDILETARGPVVLEVNLSPGLQGISAATKIDVANEIAKYLAKRTKESSGNATVQSKTSEGIIRELESEEDAKHVVSELIFRGEKILLPEFVTKMADFKENQEYVISVKKGEIVIKKF